ncbi:MAG: CvpA family protein [Chloroflexi bacterium]|nr:CvpA family protein [Chloroflexota bacterium]
MMQLSSFLVIMVGLFATVGYMRGWNKEMVATAGLVLALFALKQFETVLIDPLTDGEQRSKFYLQATILLIMGFFAYHTPPEALSRGGRKSTRNREGFQDGILGALVGGWNGYLLVGSLWWYMDNLEYPLSPHIAPVVPGSSSADFVNVLPLSWMLSGDGSILAILMIALFVYVMVAVV